MKIEMINDLIDKTLLDHSSIVEGEVSSISKHGIVIRNNDITDFTGISFRENPRKYTQKDSFIFGVAHRRTIMPINRIWATYYRGELYDNRKEHLSHLTLATKYNNRLGNPPEVKKGLENKQLKEIIGDYLSDTLKTYREKIESCSDIDSLNRIYNYEEDLSFLDNYYGPTRSYKVIYDRLIIAYHAKDKNLENVFNYNMGLLEELLNKDFEVYSRAGRVLQDLYERMKKGDIPNYKLLKP